MHWATRFGGDPPSHFSPAVCVGHNIYYFGQILDLPIPEPHIDYVDVHVLNTQTLRWAHLPDMTDENGVTLNLDVNFVRFAVAYENKIYVFGQNVLYCLDPDTLRLSRPTWYMLPDEPIGLTACVVGNRMYMLDYLDTIYVLDLQTFEWHAMTARGQLPDIVSVASVAINERIYVMSHYPQFGISIAYFDVYTREWHRPFTTGDMPFTCLTYSLFSYNGIIFVLSEMHLHSFDPRTNFWKQVSPQGMHIRPRDVYYCVIKDTKMFALDNSGSGRRNFLCIHILDFAPSLRSLALSAVAEHKLNVTRLPTILQDEVHSLSVDYLT